MVCVCNHRRNTVDRTCRRFVEAPTAEELWPGEGRHHGVSIVRVETGCFLLCGATVWAGVETETVKAVLRTEACPRL